MLTNKLLGSGGTGGIPFSITNSLILNGSNEYGTNSFGAGARDKWTFSAWLKKDAAVNYMVFAAGVSSGDYDYIQISSGGELRLFSGAGGGTTYYVISTSSTVFSDTTNFHHLVVAFDSTQATASNRVKMWFDGSAVALTFSTGVPLNTTAGYINSSSATHALGVRYRPPSSYDGYFDGLMSEVYFLDDQFLTASDFGYDDGGTWTAKAFAGSYTGTNDFYINFEDATSAATLGNDISPNNNDWTLTNIDGTNASSTVPPF